MMTKSTYNNEQSSEYRNVPQEKKKFFVLLFSVNTKSYLLIDFEFLLLSFDMGLVESRDKPRIFLFSLKNVHNYMMCDKKPFENHIFFFSF